MVGRIAELGVELEAAEAELLDAAADLGRRPRPVGKEGGEGDDAAPVAGVAGLARVGDAPSAAGASGAAARPAGARQAELPLSG